MSGPFNTDLRFGAPPNISPFYQVSSPNKTDLRFNNPNVQPVFVENASPNVYNILAYGVVGDGVTDDTAAYQAALTAATNAGAGIVYHPPNVVAGISSTLVSNSDNVVLLGGGWSSQVKALAGLGANPLYRVLQPGGSVFRYGIGIYDLFFNGNNVAGAGALDLQTTYAARVEHLRIRFCPGIGIHMNGSSGNTGAYNNISNCHITDGGAGVGLQTDFSEWLYVTGGLFSFYNGAGGIAIKSNNLNCRYIGVGFDNNDTALQLEFAGRNTVAGCQFDRGQTRFIYMHGTQYALITGNSFNTFNGVAAGQGAIDVTDGNNAGNVIVGNSLKGASTWPHFILEHGTVGTPNNLYQGNDTGGADIVLINGISRGNVGFNPRGTSVAQPAIPASTVAATNTTGADCMVNVTGGTVTVIAVGGTTTGFTSGWFRVPAGQTITLTYSVAPTWQWWGD